MNHEIIDKRPEVYLHTPRKLCLSCWEWNTQEDVGEHGDPGCCAKDFIETGKYLSGKQDTCHEYFEW